MWLKMVSKVFATIVVIGFTLNIFGIISNVVVEAVNDGYMPVVNEAFDVPVVIDEIHRFQKTGNLLFLADRLDFSIPAPESCTNNRVLVFLVRQLLARLGLPLDGVEIIASIGDVMQWVGCVTAMLFTPILIALTLALSMENVRAGKNWRGR